MPRDHTKLTVFELADALAVDIYRRPPRRAIWLGLAQRLDLLGPVGSDLLPRCDYLVRGLKKLVSSLECATEG